MAGIDIRMDGCWRMVLGTGALGVASVNLLTCLMSRHMGGWGARYGGHGGSERQSSYEFHVTAYGRIWVGMRGAPRHGFEQRVANNGGAK